MDESFNFTQGPNQVFDINIFSELNDTFGLFKKHAWLRHSQQLTIMSHTYEQVNATKFTANKKHHTSSQHSTSLFT